MAYSISRSSGNTAYGVQHFILDETDDLENLHAECAPGSTAFIVATSQKFMLNNTNAWVEITTGGGGGGGGGSDDDDHLIYDGGEEV